MDPKILANYQGPQRPSVFLAALPVAKTKRSMAALLVYATLCGFAMGGCAAIILQHIH